MPMHGMLAWGVVVWPAAGSELELGARGNCDQHIAHGEAVDEVLNGPTQDQYQRSPQALHLHQPHTLTNAPVIEF